MIGNTCVGEHGGAVGINLSTRSGQGVCWRADREVDDGLEGKTRSATAGFRGGGLTAPPPEARPDRLLRARAPPP